MPESDFEASVRERGKRAAAEVEGVDRLRHEYRRQKNVFVLFLAMLVIVSLVLVMALLRAFASEDAARAERDALVDELNVFRGDLRAGTAVVAGEEKIELIRQVDELRASNMELRSGAARLRQDLAGARVRRMMPPDPVLIVKEADLEDLDRLCRDSGDPNFEACRLHGDAFRVGGVLARRCEGGDVKACTLETDLAAMSESAAAVSRRSRALVWYDRGCRKVGRRSNTYVRSASACEEAGDIYIEKGDKGSAATYFHLACVTGAPRACLQLGILRKESDDPVVSQALFLASCLGGHGSACQYLSQEFMADWPLRRHILKAGCELGDENSCSDLRKLGLP